jgi:hypothetical protein
MAPHSVAAWHGTSSAAIVYGAAIVALATFVSALAGFGEHGLLARIMRCLEVSAS